MARKKEGGRDLARREAGVEKRSHVVVELNLLLAQICVCVCERESAQRAACPHLAHDLAHDLAHALPLECFSVSWRCT